jgi:glucosamine--fructose-6-phosphate aminotransferase (isomerizing)
MCGIIGYIGGRNAVPVVLEGLRRLEYRGYDSAGIAFASDGKTEVRRCKGKIKDLALLLESEKPKSSAAIGHTRWATHGKPSEENAHPHTSGGITLVHNGIIENHLTLKRQLQKEGFKFHSETDTEVICHLINKYSKGRAIEHAVREALKELKGAFAIAVLSDREPDKVVGARKDSPLVVGLGDGEFFIASDVPAFLSYARDVIFLNDGEMAVVGPGGVEITDFDGNPLVREAEKIHWSPTMADKGGYRHFMLKEIYEQPRAIADTIIGRFGIESGEVNLEEFGMDKGYLKKLGKVFIVACGTSWHAAVAGKYMIEELARVPVEVDIASEFRYRKPIIEEDSLFMAITQSGETADTLAAQREAKRLGARVMSICNVIGSTSSREADSVFYTRSGPEIGVASTKAFTTQLAGLFIFAVALGMAKGRLTARDSAALLEELLKLPDKVEQILAKDKHIEEIAREFFKSEDFLYLGRGIHYPIALEGALKLKEISYIHAEGYPSGEMKHGPIALIDEEIPVLFLAPAGALMEKVLSNVEEVKSRGGRIIFVTDDEGTSAGSGHSIVVPSTAGLLSSITMVIPLQLLAYHIGVLRGCDVDQPRNLAKSVTVE